VRRGLMCLGLLTLVCLAGPSNVALAAPDVALQHASDGTAVVLGSGWRPGQQLVVSLGGNHFTAYVDSGGSFEVMTSVIGYKGPVGIHRSLARAMPFGELTATGGLAPLTVLFAQSLARGAALLGLGAATLSAGWFASRPLRRRR
jgi:hypothetical protein